MDEHLVSQKGTWGSDVEIITLSNILDVDVYVANNFYGNKDKLQQEVRWSLFRGSKKPTTALYICNYCNHYESVTSMIDSSTPTYGETSNESMYIQE